MKPLKFVPLSAAVVCFACLSPTTAAPVFKPGFNRLFMSDFMNLYRSSSDCAAFSGCLAVDATNDPTDHQRVDTSLAGNTFVGDILAGIFSVNRIENPAGTINWTRSATDEFTGYFAAQFTAIVPPSGDPSGLFHVTLATAIDPFGILGAGEMFRFYGETGAGNSLFASTGTTFTNIANATEGVIWATFGLGINGFGYIHSATSGPPTTAFYGLEALSYGPVYNAGILSPINDPAESEVGGTPFGGGPLCSTGAICSDMVVSSDIIFNPAFPASSPWMLQNEASFGLFSVPEPSTVALLGFGLAGLGFVKRRAATDKARWRDRAGTAGEPAPKSC